MALNLNKSTLDKLKSHEIKHNLHTILLVDDEESNLTALKLILNREYNILTANDGQEALEMIRSNPNPERIHLIISDQRMPRMTGIEFLKNTIPIIPKTIRMILTGFTDIEAIINSINEGQVYKFLTKPIEPNELLITVKRALETFELETQNLILSASNRRLNEMNHSKETILKSINDFYQNEFESVTHMLRQGLSNQETFFEAGKHSLQILESSRKILKPISKMYFSENSIKNKRVLLAETNRKRQILAKLGLGGTGVGLDIATNLQEGAELISERNYDVICVTSDTIPLAAQAKQNNPRMKIVLMATQDSEHFLSALQSYPEVSNIVLIDEEDRGFTLKNMLTTVSKLLNEDIFGLEKYLSWGAEVKSRKVTGSLDRAHLIEEMQDYFTQLGLKRGALGRSAAVCEELLMNAIYDAPTDAQGRSLYNHLQRTEVVTLKPNEQATLFYACDGAYLAVAVEDPFGEFNRDTILQYLEQYYLEGFQKKNSNKGGAGLGISQVMELSDLVVFNVKPKLKTEVIALFDLDTARSNKFYQSFHYFLG